MAVAGLEPIYLEDPATGFAAAFEELMMLVHEGHLSAVRICVSFPDGVHQEIPLGETPEERAVILHRVKSALRRARH